MLPVAASADGRHLLFLARVQGCQVLQPTAPSDGCWAAVAPPRTPENTANSRTTLGSRKLRIECQHWHEFLSER